MSKNIKQRWMAVVGCGWKNGDKMLGALRALPNAEIGFNDDQTSFVVKFDAVSHRGAQQVLRRVRAIESAEVTWYTRVVTDEELAA